MAISVPTGRDFRILRDRQEAGGDGAQENNDDGYDPGQDRAIDEETG
jgi:hypothetical protein